MIYIRHIALPWNYPYNRSSLCKVQLKKSKMKPSTGRIYACSTKKWIFSIYPYTFNQIKIVWKSDSSQYRWHMILFVMYDAVISETKLKIMVSTHLFSLSRQIRYILSAPLWSRVIFNIQTKFEKLRYFIW